MGTINNIHKYKKAKVFTKELTEISVILREYLSKLVKYKKYIPVKDIINTTTDSKALIDSHLKQQRDILNNKGEE